MIRPPALSGRWGTLRRRSRPVPLPAEGDSPIFAAKWVLEVDDRLRRENWDSPPRTNSRAVEGKSLVDLGLRELDQKASQAVDEDFHQPAVLQNGDSGLMRGDIDYDFCFHTDTTF